MAEKELQVKEKQEVQQVGESTRPMRSFVPAVDIYETDEMVRLIAEMPGVCKECVDIGLDDGVLTIKGWTKAEEQQAAQETVLLREFEAGNYMRRFTVAESIDQEKIQAMMADGILTLTLPKTEYAKPRKIEIKAQ